jgi:8-oxo-dGTP diphosphatase
MRHRLCAGILVESEDRLLLVRHVRPGRYDFWVAPGGGVKGEEELTAAATREVREETGLEVEADRLLYIEELFQPELRICKFWYTGNVRGGKLSVAAPEAKAEHITEAAWLSREELRAKTVFPQVLLSRYWEDRDNLQVGPVHIGLRRMEFW